MAGRPLSGQRGWPEGPGQRAVICAAVRCRDAPPSGRPPLQYLAGRPPQGTIGVQPVCRTADTYRGRPSHSNSGHWPEGPGRRAADRPARTDNPTTNQLRAGDQHGGRRNGWHALAEQHTHLRDDAVRPPGGSSSAAARGWTRRRTADRRSGEQCPSADDQLPDARPQAVELTDGPWAVTCADVLVTHDNRALCELALCGLRLLGG